MYRYYLCVHKANLQLCDSTGGFLFNSKPEQAKEWALIWANNVGEAGAYYLENNVCMWLK